ncbi:GCK domain-containing protein [Raphanus sativus]|uniref:Uncharacterized protein LOC108834283 n=1 Tax=Raphanus sativus TaxID=3726 RepID=A0A6J0LSA8_RAPSA|nr:uncharacterized protein LOC108834283 [Raphanus sativus]KAJ4896252.1 GCK domain-containing protein [Raphanus sativus]
MVMTSSSSDSKPGINEAPSKKLGDSSPELGDSNSSEKLGDSSPELGDSNSSEELGDSEESVFCLFMKEGDCKDSFTAWEVCVEEAKKKNEDFVPKCREFTATMYNCMLAHSDYYQPILLAEKVYYEDEETMKEIEEAEKNKVKQDISQEDDVAATKLAQG